MNESVVASAGVRKSVGKRVRPLPSGGGKRGEFSTPSRPPKVRCIALDLLVPHPDSPNRMGRTKLNKLIHNMETADSYEPLIARPCPKQPGHFQIINGHQRCEALRRMGRTTADVIVWDVDDEQTDVLLATLNHLHGRDGLEKKLAVLRRLNRRIGVANMARLLPQARGQIERLVHRGRLSHTGRAKRPPFAIPVVFFVSAEQESALEEALAAAGTSRESTRAAKRAAALTQVARRFLELAADDALPESEAGGLNRPARADGSP